MSCYTDLEVFHARRVHAAVTMRLANTWQQRASICQPLGWGMPSGDWG